MILEFIAVSWMYISYHREHIYKTPKVITEKKGGGVKGCTLFSSGTAWEN